MATKKKLSTGPKRMRELGYKCVVIWLTAEDHATLRAALGGSSLSAWVGASAMIRARQELDGRNDRLERMGKRPGR